MSVWIKSGAVAIAAAVLFLGGYKYAAALYQADIEELKAQYALSTKELTDGYREKERTQAKNLADAWDQLERARAESVDLRDDIDRVRQLADSYRARLSQADADTCKPYQERLDRCTKLLEEGTELGAKGAEISQRVAIEKDALIKIVGHP